MIRHPRDVDWREVADVLAAELRKWGWGDMHYRPQGQEQSVVDALAVYEQALRGPQTGRRPAPVEQHTMVQVAFGDPDDPTGDDAA